MTVNELIAQLQQLATDGQGDAVVCLPDWEKTADSGAMFSINSVTIGQFQSQATTDEVAEGDEIVLLRP